MAYFFRNARNRKTSFPTRYLFIHNSQRRNERNCTLKLSARKASGGGSRPCTRLPFPQKQYCGMCCRRDCRGFRARQSHHHSTRDSAWKAPKHAHPLAWNDPDIAIPWPLLAGELPILSAKDQAGHLLKYFARR